MQGQIQGRILVDVNLLPKILLALQLLTHRRRSSQCFEPSGTTSRWQHSSSNSVSMDSDADSDNTAGVVVVHSPNEIRRVGLLLVNHSKKRLRRAKTKHSNNQFKGHFGAFPSAVAKTWEDPQTTAMESAHVEPKDLNLEFCLMALHHLKRHPTDLEREPIFDVDEMKGRNKVWFHVEKMRQLKWEKIVWPADDFGNDSWALSVDGVHFWIEEPQHPDWSQDRECFSHKCGHAGLSHELGIALDGGLIWMNGPFKAGRSDNSMFKKERLKAKLLGAGKHGIADGGYPGSPAALSAPNHHDSKPVKLFKSRALKTHEKFNGMIKTFDSLRGHFRHSLQCRDLNSAWRVSVSSANATWRWGNLSVMSSLKLWQTQATSGMAGVIN